MGDTIETPTLELDVAGLATRVETLERMLLDYAPRYVGELVPFTGSGVGSLSGEVEVRPRFLLANGAVVEQATWPALAAEYEALGFPYNTGGETSSQMRLPNLVGRSPFGRAGSGTLATVGASGGSETVTLTEAQLPAHAHTISGSVGGSDGTHSHSVTDSGHVHGSSNGQNFCLNAGGNTTQVGSGATTLKVDSQPSSNTASATTGISVGSSGSGHGHSFSLTAGNTGSGSAHQNLSPYQVIPGWLVYAGPRQD